MIYDYIQYTYMAHLPIIEGLNNNDEIIILSIDDLGNDIEQISTFLNQCIMKHIKVVSIMDRLALHPDKYFLRNYEKCLFLGSAAMKNYNYHKKQSISIMNNKNPEVEKRIGIYCRVSTREQALQGYSIENQKEKDRMYMELFDYKVKSVEYYIDEGASAGSLKRKELQRMLNDVNAEALDEIIIYKLDRLTRSVIDVYSLLQLFLSKFVNLVAVMDNLDIQTANGRMLLGILAIIAQWERETIMERTNDGLLQMAVEGKYPKSRRPFGYNKDKDKYLHINKIEAKAYKDMIELASSGYTFSNISDILIERYKIYLHPERIKRIIMDPGYYGEFEYKGYVFPTIMPALISKESVMLAQKMIGKREYGSEQMKFYFKRKIHCSVCGCIAIELPTYKKDIHYYYYYCKKCNNRINQSIILKQVLFDILNHTNIIQEKDKLIKINSKIRSLEKKLKEFTRKYAGDLITDESYNVVVNEINAKLKDARNIAITTKILDGHTWNELTDDQKKKVIEGVISYLTVDLENKKVKKIHFLKK